MNRLFDLRFVIGAFFTIVGIMLIAYGFLSHAEASMQSINRICGTIFVVFGIIMLLLSYTHPATEKK